VLFRGKKELTLRDRTPLTHLIGTFAFFPPNRAPVLTQARFAHFPSPQILPAELLFVQLIISQWSACTCLYWITALLFQTTSAICQDHFEC